jgi:D-3-phosphoglycerate dehydrogenase / 2-oxoglutarate reductase
MNILVAECRSFPAEAVRMLGEAGNVRLADLNRGEMANCLADVDVLWVRLRNQIDEALLDAAPRLKVIASPTTGLTHIDLAAVRRRGIRVVSLQGERDFLEDVRATAEHTIALMLALLRSIPAAVAHVQGGGWNRDLFRGHELYRKTVGIVGYGRLGRIVARYLEAFDARLLLTDPLLGESSVPLNVLLDGSDIVTLHVNCTPDNRHFFSRDCFARMRPGSWFINTSRGELVDEAALLAALRAGRLAGAAIDVLDQEGCHEGAVPEVVRYARTHGNLIATPHIGGCTYESMEKTEMFLARKLVNVL